MRNSGNYTYDFAHSFFGKDFYSKQLYWFLLMRKNQTNLHSVIVWKNFKFNIPANQRTNLPEILEEISGTFQKYFDLLNNRIRLFSKIEKKYISICGT